MHGAQLVREFGAITDEGNHDFGQDFDALLGDRGGGFEDRPGLHLGDIGMQNAEAAAAASEHGILFVQRLDAVDDVVERHAQLLRELPAHDVVVGQEFVQGRVEQADRDRPAPHGPEQADEVAALIDEQFLQGFLALHLVRGKNHLAHEIDALAFEKHVFGAAQADAFGPETHRFFRHGRRIGVRANLQAAHLVGPLHDQAELLVGIAFFRLHAAAKHLLHFRIRVFDHTLVDDPRAAVDRDVLAFANDVPAGGQGLPVVVDADFAGAANADLAQLARDERRVRGDAAAAGENSFGQEHALEVFGRCFHPAQDDPVAAARFELGPQGSEYDPPRRGAGAGRQALADRRRGLEGLGIEYGYEQRIHRFRRNLQQGGLARHQPFALHFHRDAHRGLARALAVARLQDEQAALFDSELQVLHVLEMLFQRLPHLHEFGMTFRHLFRHLRDGFRRAHAGNHVFALGVDQVLAVHLVLAVGRIAREGDSGGAVVTGVAEHHRLHVYRRAPFGGNAILLAIEYGALVVPGAENRADGAPQLFVHVLRKVAAGAPPDQ